MSSLKFIFKYLNYRIRAKSRYAIHSPFIYAFINEIINNRKNLYVRDKIEPIRSNLLNNHTPIEINDFGAGSRIKKRNKTISQIARRSLMSEKNASLLYRITHEFKPEYVLELGTCLGITTMYLASANPEATIYTIEGSEELSKIAQSNFKEQHFHNIHSITNTFEKSLPDLLEKLPRIDFVLIDGNHRKEPTLNYFEQLLSKSDNDTILIFDDIHWSDEMEEAWEHIQNDSRVSVCLDLFFMGIVFLKKELHKEKFTIRF